MGSLIVALLLNVSASTDPLSPYRFQPISSIEIDVPEGFDESTIRDLLELAPGQLIHTRSLRKAIKNIHRLGTIHDVQVFAERRGGAVKLRFFIEPKRLFGGVEILGLEVIDPDEMSATISPRRLSEITKETEAEMLKRATAFLSDNGFRDPVFRLSALERSTYSGVYYRLEVEERQRQIVESVRLEGSLHYQPTSLIRVVDAPVGSALTREFIDSSAKKLRTFYQGRGFPDVEISIAEPSTGNLVYTIRAGTRWFIGLHGLKNTAESHYGDLWANFLSQGTSRDANNLQQQFETRLMQLGFPEGSASIDVSSPNPHTRLVNIRIQEGRSVEIDEVSWNGALIFSPDRLQEELDAEFLAALKTNVSWSDLDDFQRRLIRGSSMNTPFEQLRGGLGRLPKVTKRWVPSLYLKALRRIETLYRDRGYFEATIEAPVITGSGAFRKVAINIDEGEVTKYGSVNFTGNEEFDKDELLEYLDDDFRIAPEQSVRLSMLEEARIGLIRRYRDQGYLYARVEFQLRSEQLHKATLEVNIDENTPVMIGRIYVQGHEHTSEEFIRNRITLEPGTPYFLSRALEDQRRLSELDIFSRVRLRLVKEEDPEPVKDLIAEVSERKRTKLQVSGGISTEDGPRIRLGWYRFNIFGEGVTANASMRLNRQIFFDLYGLPGESLVERYDSYSSASEQVTKALEREVRLGLKSPPIMGLPGQPVLRVDLLNERDNRIAYSLDALRLLSGIDFRPYPWLLAELEPGFTITNLECADPSVDCGQDLDGNQNSRLRLDRGQRVGGNLGAQVTIDFRNSPFNPSRGWSLQAGTEYAQGYVQDQGSSQELYAFLRSESRLTGYIPLGESVIALALWGGRIDVLNGEDAPIDQRFFLGGRQTLRGFFDDSIFPADACLSTEVRDNCRELIPSNEENPSTIPIVGGHSYILAKSELRLKLNKSLTLNSFLEAGNLWYRHPTIENFELRLGLGTGLSYTTPVGPLAISVGFNPFRKERYYESLYEFHISIGQF